MDPDQLKGDAQGKILIVNVEKGDMEEVDKIFKSDAEWEKDLKPLQFQVTRKKKTELPFTGEYWNTKSKGIYKCVACGTDLFLSDTKFDSRTGWPSFWQPVAEANVHYEIDTSLFVKRTEVLCRRCGAHLGHVFDDGPLPTNQRFCINSAALKFKAKE